MRKELIDAIHDYRWLLDKKYPHKISLDIVSTRYMLSRKERVLLYRCIHDKATAQGILRKTSIPPSRSRIIIDGFNIFATIYSVLIGEHVYLCDDGIIRDLLGLHGKIAVTTNKEVLAKILRLILDIISGREYELTIILDSSVTKSGLAASFIRKFLEERDVCGRVFVEKKADRAIINYSGDAWICSSDIVILRESRKIYDLAGEVIRRKFPQYIVIVPLREI
ncbi:MAG: DUF434 domain-containing protein [Desulfurococcales archaeon]|nr:DUF434 domain-containing protein [Desulfurococcales archaeon]